MRHTRQPRYLLLFYPTRNRNSPFAAESPSECLRVDSTAITVAPHGTGVVAVGPMDWILEPARITVEFGGSAACAATASG